MLFKQWDEVSEPRHQLDSPVVDTHAESLQTLPLPIVTVDIPTGYKKLILVSKVLKPLFSEKLFPETTDVGSIRAQLSVESTQHDQFLLDDDSGPTKRDFHIELPVCKIEDGTLMVCVEETPLTVPAVIYNAVAYELAKSIPNAMHVLVCGTSDKVFRTQHITNETTTLVPPSFFHGFAAGIIANFLQYECQFQAIIAPSEGPVGYEKLSLSTMQEIIQIVYNTHFTTKNQEHVTDCLRYWRADGPGLGAHAGLYI